MTDEEILDYIREHQGCTSYDISLALQVPQRSVTIRCRDMVKAGRLASDKRHTVLADGRKGGYARYYPAQYGGPKEALRQRGEYRGERLPFRYEPRTTPALTLAGYAWEEDI